MRTSSYMYMHFQWTDYILVVSENPLEIPQSFNIQFPCTEILQKHLIWWKESKNVLIDCPLHVEEHNLLSLTNASVNGWGTHLFLVL